MSRKKNKLIFGWGVNDVDYEVYKYEVVNGKKKVVWVCPYYQKWKDTLKRCFDSKHQEKYPTYKGCTVTEDWKYLSNFIKWVNKQPNKDWVNCQPDKDILVNGNKHYSPETVVFISNLLNSFITDSLGTRGGCMIGVSLTDSKINPYRSNCSNPFTKGSGHMGMFPTELEAHKAWQAKKHEYACQLADLQSDPRVAKALRERYAPDKDWTKR